MSKAMNYSSWILTLFLIINIASLCSNSTHYSDHCDSIVHEPASSSNKQEVANTFSLPQFTKAYCIGGSPVVNTKNSPSPTSRVYIAFNGVRSYKTNVHGVFKIEAILILSNMANFYYYDPAGLVLKFMLNGFWSEDKGKLCMIGDGGYSLGKSGKFSNLSALLELDYAKDVRIDTSLVNGVFRSLNPVHDSNYFEPVSIMMVSDMNYGYGLVLKAIENGEFKRNVDDSLSLPLISQPEKELCSIFRSDKFELIYQNCCDVFAKSCCPFNSSTIGFLPTFTSLNPIECSENNSRIRILVKFFNSSYGQWDSTDFDPKFTLIGEGFWDDKTNQLYIAACKIMNITNSFENTRVGDCSVRLMLRFPAICSIKNKNTMLGQIWSTKHVNDSDYFKKIKLKSVSTIFSGVPGLKYEYSQIEKVRKLCPLAKNKDDITKKKEKYPSESSHDMAFEMSVKNSEGAFGSGFSAPLTMGDHFYEYGYWMDKFFETEKHYTTFQSHTNISYRISFAAWEISAEGVYDSETGELCMVGCRENGSRKLDCEIILKIQFPSPKNTGQGYYIKGSIESTRKNISDPLYFERLNITSVGYDEIITGRDFVIPFMGLAFAALIFLQQRFGIRCFSLWGA